MGYYFCFSGFNNNKESFDPDQRSTPSIKQSTFRYVLANTKQALDSLGIPFFLSSGTCLGYARERDFMDHDYDIDIGILEKDYTPKLIDKMREHGLIFYRIFGTFQTGMELSFYLPISPLIQRAKIDIFVHKDIKDKKCWYSYDVLNKKKLKYCVSDFDLEPVDFLGIKVNIPSDVKKYLKEHYGKDWRIPKSNGLLGEYQYFSSPLSLINDIDFDFIN